MSETGHQGIDAASPGLKLGRLFDLAERKMRLGLRVAEPGRVVNYDPILQRADVTRELVTVVRGNTPQTADVETPVLPPMLLQRVPVLWPRTALGYVTFPLVAGDTGLLVFCDRSLERWKSAGTPDAPADARAHSFADGVFVPGMHADTNPITPPTRLDATVIEGPTIRLGALAVQPVVLGLALRTALETFVASMITANTTWAGNPVTAPAFSTSLGTMLGVLQGQLSTILSTKVSTE